MKFTEALKKLSKNPQNGFLKRNNWGYILFFNMGNCLSFRKILSQFDAFHYTINTNDFDYEWEYHE